MALRIACDLDGTLADMDGALQHEADRLFGAGVAVRARAPRLERTETVTGLPNEAPALERDVAILPVELPEGLEGPNGTERASAAPKPAGLMNTRTAGRPLTRGEIRRLWTHVRHVDDFWVTLAEVEPGTVSQFAVAAAQHGWEVIFLTRRPATRGDTAQRQSQRWLETHGFGYASVYVMNGSRGKVAEALALDVVLDDRMENCIDVTADSKARSVLVWRDDSRPAPAGAAGLGVTVVYSFGEALVHLQRMTESARPRGLFSRLRRRWHLATTHLRTDSRL